jgi:hypothetical protein
MYWIPVGTVLFFSSRRSFASALKMRNLGDSGKYLIIRSTKRKDGAEAIRKLNLHPIIGVRKAPVIEARATPIGAPD